MRNRLKEFRAKSGLTLEELADRAGLSFGYLSRIERGERPLAKKWAVALAPHLGASWATLMDEPSSGFADAADAFAAPAGPPPEYDRLPDMVQALTAALRELEITLPPRAVTRHAQEAMHQATRMDRRLPFEERARLAAEAKAADINRTVG
jgi:transcriptional regulator with XRE-family HTH domain